jgi:dolichol-phosphate mannosyltransferase
MKVVVLIMTYNEKENVGPMMDAWLKIAKENPKYQFEVLIIDANSPDGTGKIVEKYHQQHENIKLLSGPRMGYGKDLVKGYKYAMEELKADIVLPIDADFQWDPFLTPKLLEKIDEGYDVVVASRSVPGGKDNFNLFRKLTHWASDVLLAYYWAGIKEVKDHAGAFKAIRVKGILDQVQLEKLDVTGFVVQMKTIYELSKTKAKFYEVPAIYGLRKAGEATTVGLKSLPRFLKYVFEYAVVATKIRIERSQQIIKFGIVGFIGFIVNTVGLEVFVFLGIRPSISGMLGAELAIISNFILNNFWTFAAKKIVTLRKAPIKFIQFNLTSVGAVLIQGITIELGTRILGSLMNTLFSGFFVPLFGNEGYRFFYIMGVGLGMIWNYFAYTTFIWKTRQSKLFGWLQKRLG